MHHEARAAAPTFWAFTSIYKPKRHTYKCTNGTRHRKKSNILDARTGHQNLMTAWI